MSFLNSLGKGLVAIGLAEDNQEEAPSAAAPTQAVAPVSSAAPVPASATVTPPEDPARIAELDKAVREGLLQALEKDGAPLVEELHSTLETLTDAIPDERARFLAALKLMAKKGPTVASIL